MTCIKQEVAIDAPLPELLKFYWEQRRGCCPESMRIKRRREEKKECGCPTRRHQKNCPSCDQFVDEVLMEIWRQWEHGCWWEFGVFFYKMNVLGQFDSFFLNINEKDIKLSHLNVYVQGFLPGLVCIM